MEIVGDNVAIAYYQTIPHTLRLDGIEYAFVVKANICMSWIPSRHMESVLRTIKTCCGGQRKRVYRLANADDVRRWSNGGGR